MKAIIYARYSPRPKDQSETTETIESQTKRCNAFAAYLGHELEAEYSDRDMSGKNTDRPGLQAALAHVKRFGKHGVLIVYSLSRLSRSVKDRIEIAEDLTRRGVQLASVTEMFDTSRAHGRMIFNIMAAIDQGVREIGNEATSDKMIDYQDNGNGEGRRMGRVDKLRYGWEPDPDSPAHPKSGLPTGVRECAEEQGIIKRILGLHKRGVGGNAIQRYLQTAGVKYRGRDHWNATTIRRIIRREG